MGKGALGIRLCILVMTAAVGTACGGESPATDAGRDAAGIDASSSCPDSDGDGHADATCGGDDCDDANANRFPGNAEVCDSAGIDEDCVPTTFAGGSDGDTDGDGFVAEACCNITATGTSCGPDCDDSDANINPSALDTCGGGDQDCDGETDENPDVTFYRDVDSDGFGSSDDTVLDCAAPAGYAVLDGDCNDALMGINPNADEVCEGSVDENCSGTIDEGCPCTIGEVDDECGPDDETGACRFGSRTCGDDATWGDCIGAVVPGPEICNGGSADEDDENCDGTIDEAATCDCTNGDDRTCAASGATSFGFPSICTQVIQTCLDGHWPRSCDDELITGPSTETCDGVWDENCDGIVDNNPPCSCTDGHTRTCSSNRGECTEGTEMCSSGAWVGCTGDLPTSETCDHLDNDCDGFRDDGVYTNCTYSDSTALVDEFICPPEENCVGYATGDALMLGWDWTRYAWSPGYIAPNRVVYLPTAVDWGLLQFTVTARVTAGSPYIASARHAMTGVMFSPRATQGTDGNYGLPQLGSGETGWAAGYDTITGLVHLFELRDGAAPVVRASSTTLGCPIGVGSFREFTIELSYELGTLTAEVSSSGCGRESASVTLTSGQLEGIVGYSPSYPTYYPGAFGKDLTGGTGLILTRFDVDQYWSCDGCPW